MAAWLKISFKGNEEMVESLTKKGATIIEVLATKVTTLMQQLASYVVTEKLSGQVLAKRTGVLQASVKPIPTTIEGTTIRAGIQAAAGPAYYGKILTLGISKPYEIMAVKKKALAFMLDGKKTFARSVVHPAMPPRPFLAPAWEENREEMLAELRAALNQATKS